MIFGKNSNKNKQLKRRNTFENVYTFFTYHKSPCSIEEPSIPFLHNLRTQHSTLRSSRIVLLRLTLTLPSLWVLRFISTSRWERQTSSREFLLVRSPEQATRSRSHLIQPVSTSSIRIPSVISFTNLINEKSGGCATRFFCLTNFFGYGKIKLIKNSKACNLCMEKSVY